MSEFAVINNDYSVFQNHILSESENQVQDVNLAEYSQQQSAALRGQSLNESSMSHHDQRGVLG